MIPGLLGQFVPKNKRLMKGVECGRQVLQRSINYLWLKNILPVQMVLDATKNTNVAIQPLCFG